MRYESLYRFYLRCFKAIFAFITIGGDIRVNPERKLKLGNINTAHIYDDPLNLI